MLSKSTAVIAWVVFVHLAGIYLFTSGFLLTRLALTATTTCTDNECTVPATHKRAVFLIIDALRFDFVSPHPPTPVSAYHHNILTLPQELTKAQPRHSFLYNAYSDPPTTTLQRIKGLTTGSLPTFVDLGNNFGASSIEEDSIMKQLELANKTAAFMGDDTWMSVFPHSFAMAYPYDSFNVEDLHTVDEGVISHLFPLLEDSSKPFDFLVGHFLGVDHVGHRVGPDHPSMKSKLEQMNDVLGRIVDLLDDETLLVVLGDHGMDRTGDHGGDGVHETSSALWVYSKGPEISTREPHSSLLEYTTFPGASVPSRFIQQIDILPTISLLLGLPIPFNNLGTIIPELFCRSRGDTMLKDALKLNSAQIHRYLDAYRASASGGELDPYWDNLQNAWDPTMCGKCSTDDLLIGLNSYNRVALSTCRALWAQFNPLRMAFGLAVLGVGFVAQWSMYMGLSASKYDWDAYLSQQMPKCLRGISGGAIIGLLMFLGLEGHLEGMDALDCILFATPVLSSVMMMVESPPPVFSSLRKLPIPLVLHTLAFFSNSFTFWEDRLILYLSLTSLVPFVLTGVRAATSRLRYRILGFSLLYAVCVRLMAISTVCREEQQPYCHVTFYASSTVPSPPLAVLALVVPAGFALPYVIHNHFLKTSAADRGLAQTFIPIILRPTLLAGSGFWLLEWLDSSSVLEDEYTSILRLARTWLARCSFCLILFVGGTLWYLVPLCLHFDRSQARQVKVLGFANAYGSGYLLFWTVAFGLVYNASQLSAQIVLGLGALALVSFLEVVDSARDVRYMEQIFASATPSDMLKEPTSSADQSPPLEFADIIPVALLGLHMFFSTGHQSTISSIQWKSGFILTPGASYVFAPITVILNTFGPLFLAGLAAPLLALWNRPPLMASVPGQTPQLDIKLHGEAVQAVLGMMLYYASLLIGSSVSAAVLRRHLMVWKVFAPRFMAAVAGLLMVDIAALVGFLIGFSRITSRINHLFKSA